jgi:site-specific DNA-methyltransferase (adenine-specific)
MKKNFQIVKNECVAWMSEQSPKSIECIVTSPPYNLSVKYGTYDDSMPRINYLKWMGDVANAMKETLKPNGQIFLNVGYTNTDPFISMDVAQVFRKYFILIETTTD